MRYITIPPPVPLFNPETDAPVVDPDTKLQVAGDFASAMRHLCSNMMRDKALDALDIIELRTLLSQAKVGDEVGIDNAWHTALDKAFARPDGFNLVYLTAAKPHILAVKDATHAPRG